MQLAQAEMSKVRKPYNSQERGSAGTEMDALCKGGRSALRLALKTVTRSGALALEPFPDPVEA